MNKQNINTDPGQILLTLDEFNGLQRAGAEYLSEASRCFSSSLHPFHSGCHAIAGAIYTTLLLTAHLRASSIKDIHVLPRVGNSYTSIYDWEFHQAIRVADYMGWYPSAFIESESSKYLAPGVNISDARLCHIHELRNPKVLAKCLSDSETEKGHWKKAYWRNELQLWLRVNKLLLSNIYREGAAWRSREMVKHKKTNLAA